MASMAPRSTYTHDSFLNEISSRWAEIVIDDKVTNQSEAPKKEWDRGFLAYENARIGQLKVLLLGGPEIREDVQMIRNFGTLATRTQTKANIIDSATKSGLEAAEKIRVQTLPGGSSAKDKRIRPLKELMEEHLHMGGIMNDGNWWIFRNDAFILGGVHGNREFHLEKIPSENLLWDKKANRPRVLGRELIILQLAGYQLYSYKRKKLMGYVFMPPTKTALPTLMECRSQIKSVNKIQPILDYLNSRVEVENPPFTSRSGDDKKDQELLNHLSRVRELEIATPSSGQSSPSLLTSYSPIGSTPSATPQASPSVIITGTPWAPDQMGSVTEEDDLLQALADSLAEQEISSNPTPRANPS